MSEDFLHFLWKYQLFEDNLITLDGEKVTVINAGWHNHNAGPDFTMAKIKIGETTWVGNVEIHINSSDWIKHKHALDKLYQNLILHVVYHQDIDLKMECPTVEVGTNINDSIEKRYRSLITQKSKIPCENFLFEIDDFTWMKWKSTLLVNRMEDKYHNIELLLNKYTNSWEEVFYILMAKNFGFKVNSLPFEMLAKSIPLKYLAKIKGNVKDVEALFYGQAGLLEVDFKEEYPNDLKKRYSHFKRMWNLSAIDKTLWRFLRLRPANFPHIRISQFAHLIHKSKSLFSHIRDSQQIQEVTNLLYCHTSEYWKTHYVFDKPSAMKVKTLGTASINLIMINTVIPMLFAYGKYHENEDMKEQALEYLYHIPVEKNQIIRKWKILKVPVNHAFDSQSLIQLTNNYCLKKNCLNCVIGTKILNKQ